MKNEILATTNHSPIEVALGIDEHGMTTASKLYAFLGLSPIFRKQVEYDTSIPKRRASL